LAVTVTGVVGTTVGAVYSPADETVPRLEEPPVVPLTSHVTAVFDVPETVELNCLD